MWANDPLKYIIGLFAAIAKSNSVLMGAEISSDNRENLNEIVYNARLRYQELCKYAASYYRKIRQDGGIETPVASPASSRATSPIFKKPLKSRSKVEEESQLLKEKVSEHLRNTKRPNIHVGLHYEQMMREYALPSMCNVLIGEDKH